jgi:hypothetical protein
VHNATNVTQCSLAFDQNGHINVAYTANGIPYLHWYDTDAADWVTDVLAAGTTSPTLCLDDKREMQTNANDVILWYTVQQGDTTWNLYRRLQRERYQTAKLMSTDVHPFIFKLGMHRKWRVQIALSDTVAG